MKRCLILAFVLAAGIAAQIAKEVEITSEPHHHLALQNKYVRAFKVEVPPHTATLMHRHRYDYAYVTIGATEIANQPEGEPAVHLRLQDGQTEFSPGNFAHIARDLADTPFRNVTVEFLQGRNLARSTANWTDQRGLEILDGGTQDILFVRDGVRASDIQLNPGAMLPAAKHAHGQLLISVSAVDLRIIPAGSHVHDMHMRPGDIQWLDATPALMNSGKQPARFISFDFR